MSSFPQVLHFIILLLFVLMPRITPQIRIVNNYYLILLFIVQKINPPVPSRRGLLDYLLFN